MGVDLNVNNQINLTLNPANNNPAFNQFQDLFNTGPAKSPFADFLRQVLNGPAGPGGFPPVTALRQTPQDQMLQGLSQLLQGLGRSLEQHTQYRLPSAPGNDLSSQLNSLGDGMQGIADMIGLLQGDLGGLPSATPFNLGPGPVVNPFDTKTGPKSGSSNDEALKTIDKNFDALAGSKGYFDKKDLEAAAKDKKNPELAAAAQYLLDNPMLMNGLDTAFQDKMGRGGKTDGHVSRADMSTGLASTKNTAAEQDLVKTLLSFGNDLFKDGKGTVSEADLKKIATTGKLPNGKDAPAELVAAVKQLLANPSLMQKLDSAFDVDSGRFKNKTGLDKEISLKDLLITAEKRPTTPASDKTSSFFTGSPLMANFGATLLDNLQRQGADPNMLNLLRQAIKAA